MYFQIKTTYNRPKLSYTSDLTTNSRVSSLANPSQHCLYLGLCHVISYWFILVSFKILTVELPSKDFSAELCGHLLSQVLRRYRAILNLEKPDYHQNQTEATSLAVNDETDRHPVNEYYLINCSTSLQLNQARGVLNLGKRHFSC